MYWRSGLHRIDFLFNIVLRSRDPGFDISRNTCLGDARSWLLASGQ